MKKSSWLGLVLPLLGACSWETASSSKGVEADAGHHDPLVTSTAPSTALPVENTPPEEGTADAAAAPHGSDGGANATVDVPTSPSRPPPEATGSSVSGVPSTPTSATGVTAPSANSAPPDASSAVPDTRAIRVVVLGTSTAAGKNLDEPNYGGAPEYQSWVELYADYLAKQRPGSEVVNLAIAGTTSFEAMPTGTVNPDGYPAVDPARNITAALALSPDAVIVSYHLGSGASTAQILSNLSTIRDAASSAGAQTWFSTPNPRPSDIDPTQIFELTDAILSTFADHALDFFTPRADADGYANPDLILSDGSHPNQAGHQLLFQVVRDAHIPEAVLDLR